MLTWSLITKCWCSKFIHTNFAHHVQTIQSCISNQIKTTHSTIKAIRQNLINNLEAAVAIAKWNGVSVWPQIYAHGIYFTCRDMCNANKSLDLRVNAFMDENRNLKSQRSALEKDKTTFHAHFYRAFARRSYTHRESSGSIATDNLCLFLN